MNNRMIVLLGTLCLALPAWGQSEGPAPEVIVQKVSEERISTRVEALGTVRANESIRLSPNLTRTVTRVNFEDGQRVKRGQLLVEMTSAEELALLDEARIHADDAKRQLDRSESLVQQGAVSQSELDQRVREYQSAQARLQAIEARLEDLRLRAPFDGVVGLRNTSVGALVSPGEVITTLNDDSQMKLDFTVPSIYLRHLAVGIPVRAHSRALGERVFEGEVYSIDNRLDPVTRSITVRAILPNEDRLLKQGLLMSVELSTREREALMVSEAALVTTGSDHSVYLVRGEEGNWRVERASVEIGQRLVGKVEILSGLDVGERVVTHGLQKVRNGQEVRIMAEESGSEPLSGLLNGEAAKP